MRFVSSGGRLSCLCDHRNKLPEDLSEMENMLPIQQFRMVFFCKRVTNSL